MNNSVREQLNEHVDVNDLIFVDGFDDAIIGLDTTSKRIVYSKQIMIEICLEVLEYEYAMSQLTNNIWGVDGGDKRPIFIDEIKFLE
jgi:hypothetical protein